MKVNYYLVPPKGGKVIRMGPQVDGVITETDGKNVITILQDNKPYICKFEDWGNYIKTGKRPDWLPYEGESVGSETYEYIWTVVRYSLGEDEKIVRYCNNEELAKKIKQQFEEIDADDDTIHYSVEKELLLVSQED